MATVHGSAQWRLVDFTGASTSKIIYFDVSDAATLAQIITDLHTEEGLLDAVTDAATNG